MPIVREPDACPAPACRLNFRSYAAPAAGRQRALRVAARGEPGTEGTAHRVSREEVLLLGGRPSVTRTA